MMSCHTAAVAATVSLDLTYFSKKFVESGFLTQTAASDVLSKLGVSSGDKSQELLLLVTHNYKISLRKQVWANKFIAILFSSQAAHSDLATLLRGDPLPEVICCYHCSTLSIVPLSHTPGSSLEQFSCVPHADQDSFTGLCTGQMHFLWCIKYWSKRSNMTFEILFNWRAGVS